MFSDWRLATARLVMTPVDARDLPQLAALKADPRAFSQMLGGVRSRQQAQEDLAQDIALWGAHGYGMWTVRARDGGAFLGVTGLMHRPDQRGVALRYALRPDARGTGMAREAASAALFFAHDRAGISRVIGVTREENFGSRIVLGSIGMTEVERFIRGDYPMLVYQSLREQCVKPIP